MAAVDERFGTIAVREDRPLSEVSNGFTAFEEGDVLFAKITPCMENGKIALARELTNGIGRGSTEFFVLRPGDRVLAEYVYHLVRQPSFRETAKKSFTGTAGQRRVPKAFMEEVLVPLPSFSEQRKVIEILNQSIRIERMRVQAGVCLQEFAQALFIKLFGEPSENPMCWKLARLGEFAEFRYGTSEKCYSHAASNTLPVLRIPNVLNGAVNWANLKFTSAKLKETEKFRLQTGDLLFVRTNGNPDYIGRCAVFNDHREAAYASYLIRARLMSGAATCPEYVAGSFTLPSVRSAILKLARTTAGNYNINIKSLKGIAIPIPPAPLQQKYAETIKNARRLTTIMESASQTSRALSSSLVSQLLSPYG